MVTSPAYWAAVAVAAVVCTVLCVAARHRPGPWTAWARRALAIVLLGVAASFVISPVAKGTWTAHSSLPVDLCDVVVVVAAIACWHPQWVLAVELTYFWGLAGSLQAVATPDLNIGFPRAAFWAFVLGHLGIVVAAIFLVVGLGIRPRRGAVPRMVLITVLYTAFVGVVDAITGGNYMYLRHLPGHVSLLSVLGPWPWYLLGAAAVAVVLFALLDAPFRR